MTIPDRLRTTAFWGVPPVLALLLYWPGLTCWFQKDDFAWLGLKQAVADGQGSYWWALLLERSLVSESAQKPNNALQATASLRSAAPERGR